MRGHQQTRPEHPKPHHWPPNSTNPDTTLNQTDRNNYPLPISKQSTSHCTPHSPGCTIQRPQKVKFHELNMNLYRNQELCLLFTCSLALKNNNKKEKLTVDWDRYRYPLLSLPIAITIATIATHRYPLSQRLEENIVALLMFSGCLHHVVDFYKMLKI